MVNQALKSFYKGPKVFYISNIATINLIEVFEKCDDKSVYLEWERLINLEVDGICTKYPEKLIKFVKGDLN